MADPVVERINEDEGNSKRGAEREEAGVLALGVGLVSRFLSEEWCDLRCRCKDGKNLLRSMVFIIYRIIKNGQYLDEHEDINYGTLCCCWMSALQRVLPVVLFILVWIML